MGLGQRTQVKFIYFAPQLHFSPSNSPKSHFFQKSVLSSISYKTDIILIVWNELGYLWMKKYKVKLYFG